MAKRPFKWQVTVLITTSFLLLAVRQPDLLRQHSDSTRFPPLIQIKEAARSFSTISVEGQRINLDSYRGNPVLLEFWATWCNPYLRIIEEHSGIIRRFQHRSSLGVISVSLDKNIETAQRFMKQHEFTHPLICDGRVWHSYVSKLYGIKQVPFWVVIDSDGLVTYAGSDYSEIRTLSSEITRSR